MMRLKLPPRVKVLEALGSIADGRVRVINDSEAEVKSSTGDRVYKVLVDVKSNKVFSNDNGTYYRNYVGYPIIAFLMVKGILPYDDKLANALKGINWRKINETYKNYSLVENHVKDLLKSKNFSAEYVDKFIDEVLKKLKSLPLYKISDNY
jgi:DNA-dependent RNA polymerase auxiliary subunit epsilon